MPNMNIFTGYTPDVAVFFSNLEKNNTKDWFDNHRSFYEKQIRDTTKALISEMAARFAAMGLPFISDPRRSMFRINRDTRFSNNKDPYKTNLGVFFPYSISNTMQKPVCALGMYFHFDHKETFIAGGLHTPPPDILLAIRNRIDEDWEELERIANNNSFVSEFPDTLHGESLKRIPAGFPKDHPAEKYLKLKQFLVLCPIKHEDIYSDTLQSLLIQKAIAIAPFLDFFQAAIDAKE